eukprot:CAMPEP_0119269932 /NCGR_PEP_ID=MMETSP1329-20130426/7137_1 /TAXON_ID=114041 /ORGANISM="Genus nov. species nov., Strain RCC1024" /LENGTH=97 /DNA_ID=CAMNT_0007269935 /DNA_START=67 /DNA_END=356 /DNA_ORIENTATION=+
MFSGSAADLLKQYGQQVPETQPMSSDADSRAAKSLLLAEDEKIKKNAPAPPAKTCTKKNCTKTKCSGQSCSAPTANNPPPKGSSKGVVKNCTKTKCS